MALDRDAYFTPLKDSQRIIEQLLKDEPVLKELDWVEPSAGSGSFLYAAEQHGIDIQGYDIHPLRNDIVQVDFLQQDLNLKNKAVIGNPPYGRRNSLTIEFIDRAFKQGAEYVGFLLMGGFMAHSTISRIKEPCEIIAIRQYNIQFENEHGEKVNSNILKLPMVFILLKKSTQKIKELPLNETYIKVNPSIDDADFVTGYQYLKFGDFPEYYEKNNIFYLQQEKPKRIYFFKCANPDKFLIEYILNSKLDGYPTQNTLNFYTTYMNIIRDC